MGFRQDLDAVRSKLRLTEAEIERVRARLAPYEGVDLDEDDERLLDLERRLEELQPRLREVDQLREEGAELRAQLVEAEARLVAAQKARPSQPRRSGATVGGQEVGMIVFAVLLSAVSLIAAAFIFAMAMS